MEANSKSEIQKINTSPDSLKKFTIPRKRTIDTAYLEICHTDWREYSFIQSTLEGSKLDSSYRLNLQWKFGDIKLIHNVKLEQRFAEKRSKMREEGRRGKEIEENTFFLVTSHNSALKLYQDGLSINSSDISALGNPAYGVYLHRHIDVLLKYHKLNKLATETILFFKVLLGRVRTIPPCKVKDKIDVKPTAKFDCHMSQIPADLKDPINIQAINSAVYLYEFNELCETMECPRHCLPYALVPVRFMDQDVKSAVVPCWYSSAATQPSLPELSRLKSCTIAQRLGKGKNAKVVYQQFCKKRNPPASPVRLSPSSSLGNMATSSTSQDPRLAKRDSCAENGKEYSFPAKISLPVKQLNNINTLIRTICFLNACTSLPAQQLCVNEATQPVLDRAEEDPAQIQGSRNAAEDHKNLGPSGMSVLVMTSASGRSQSTPDSPTIVSEAAIGHGLKTVEKDNDLSSLTELDMEVGSDTQKSTFPSRSNAAEHSEQPFFEDLNLYESEIKSKLRKYSAYLMLCDKERLSKIDSLQRLSQVDKRAFYYRLKKYEKYYERYKNELGLGTCWNTVPSEPHDRHSLCNSDCSSAQDAKSCSCVLTHWGISSGCSTDLVIGDTASGLSGSKGPGQSATMLSDAKGMEEESVGGSQTTMTAVSHVLPDGSGNGSGLSHNTEAVTAEQFGVCTENTPGTSLTAEMLQRSADDGKTRVTQDVSTITKCQLQASPPSVASNSGGDEHSVQFNFFSAVHHSHDRRVTNAEISDSHGTPGVSNGRINVGENYKNRMVGLMQSSLEDGRISNSEERSVPDTPLEEVQMSITSAKYIKEAYEKSPNLDSLLHFVGARIEWENLFETSTENELQINLDSGTATKPDNVGQQVPPPAVTEARPLSPRCPEAADAEGNIIQKLSVSMSERLPVSSSQIVIPNLQITLSSGLNAKSDPHPELTELSDQVANHPGISGESHRLIRTITEGKRGRCLKTAEKALEVVFHGLARKSMLENSGLRETSQTDVKGLNAEGEACDLISKSGLHHTSSKTALNCPNPHTTKNCMHTDFLCAFPMNKQPPASGRGGCPNNRDCNIASVEKLAEIRSDMPEVESLSDYHDTKSINRDNHAKSKRYKPRSSTDNLCEESVLRKNIRKMSASKSHGKDLKKLTRHSKKLNYLEKDSKFTSNCDIALNFKQVSRELCMSRKNTYEDSRVSVQQGIVSPTDREHKPIKEDNSFQFTDKTKAISCCDKNVKTLREQNQLDSKALPLVQPEWCTKSISQVRIPSTDGNKRNFRGADSSADNLYSLCKGRVDAFNNCQRQIAHAVSVLSSEAFLSKSSQLSKLLTHAVRDLNKALEKVDRSSEIVRRIGVDLNQSLLPKSYQANCNTFWESCDAYCWQHRKKRRNQSVGETDSKDSGITGKEQPKSAIADAKLLCKRRRGAECGRQGSKSEQAACATGSVKPASVPNVAVNPGVFSNYMQSKDHPQSVATLKNRVRITQRRSSHDPLHKSRKTRLPDAVCVQTAQAGAGSTSVDPQVDSHLMSAEVMGIPVDPKPSESSTTSTLGKSQMELDPDSQEGRMCVWGSSDLETVLEFPVVSPVVEDRFDSQMEEFLNKPQEVELSPASQSVKYLDARHPMKSSSELTRTGNRLQSQSESEAGTPSGQDQRADCKCGSSDLNSPCGCQKLDIPLPIKVPESSAKFGASQHLLHPQATQFQTSSSEKMLLVDNVPHCFKDECPVISFTIGSDSQQTTVTSRIVASDLVPGTPKPCVELKATELQAETPKSNSQFEFSVTSKAAESWINPQNTGIGPEMGCATVLQAARSPAVCHAEQCTSDSQRVETQIDSGTVALQERPSTVKFQKESSVKPRNEDSAEMEKEEGEIALENRCEVINVRVPAVSRKAGRAEDQSLLDRMGHNIRLSQNTKEAQRSGVLVAKISEILYQADSTSRLESLERLKVKCERMLPTFILGFEQSQGVSFAETVICRDWLLKNGLHSTAGAVHLKPSALEPYVELQMIMETVQFLQNKISFLTGGPRLRSLLWYDETLYGDLLTKKVGCQQQSSLYPSFQERVASSCLEALSDYQTQILKSCQTEARGQNAYYVYLKHRRELDECSSVIQNLSDCSCFCLSVPVTSSINYGDTLEDLEALRKNVWALISRLASLPEGQRDVAKLLHLWVIIDFVNGKTRHIHGSPVPNEELGWFGLEHLQFNAAKMLAWQKKGKRKVLGDDRDWGQAGKTRKRISELDREALCLLYNRRGSVGRMSLNSKEQTDVSQVAAKLPRTVSTASFQSVDAALPEHQELRVGNCLQRCFQLLSKQFDSVGRILERSRGVQQAELGQLLVKCESQVESLKELFHVLQEVEAEKVLATEANFLLPPAAQDTDPILLNSEATEIYIELLMMFETAHYLRNLIAHHASRPTYRGLLWFDLSLLPELLHDQQDNSIFSLCRKEYLQDSTDELERVISTLEQELDLIFEYKESTNYTYAVKVLSRELSEVMAVRDHMQQHNLGVGAFVNTVPYTASINYGNTESDLSHNYRQLVALLEKLIRAPVKDLGKMAHVMEVMKSIMDMRQVTAESTSSALHILTYQMRLNSRKRRLLEHSEMVRNSPKLGNSPNCPEAVQWGTLVDVTAGDRHRGGPLIGKRKRQRSDPPLVSKQGELGVDSPTREVRPKYSGRRSSASVPEC